MKKKVIAIIVALVLLLAAVVTIISCVPTKDKTQENSVASGVNGDMTENQKYAMPRAMSFSQKGLDKSATGSVSVNVYAVVYPENAPKTFRVWFSGLDMVPITNIPIDFVLKLLLIYEA